MSQKRRRRRVSPDRDVCDPPRKQLADRFDEQAERCYYCLRQCWLKARETAAAAATRLGVKLSRVWELQASREHLRRWAEAGRDNNQNIVMACLSCNFERGERSVLKHVKAM